jgi:probable DNA repair protein
MHPALPPLDFDALAALPASQVLVLTVNNRLARTLTGQLAARADRAIELPSIQPLSTWLSALAFDRSFESGAPLQLLTPQQANVLWAQVIAEHSGEHVLIDVQQAASLALQADTLMLHWKVRVQTLEYTPDHEQFLHWRAAYESRLSQLGVLDPARLAAKVGDWIEQGACPPPARVVLAGFAEYSPLIHGLCKAMASHGAELYELATPAPVRTSDPVVRPCASVKDEWVLATQWARAMLDQDPTGKYAIVAPALQAQASLARRVLARDLGFAFNVAVAPALSEWPLGRALLAWLGLMVKVHVKGSLSASDAGAALLVGHCAGARSEAGARAAIDAAWRRDQRVDISLAKWSRDIAALPRLMAAWKEVALLWQDQGRGKKTWFEWADRFRAGLAAVGFPGEGTQTSVQYQTCAALDTLLSQLAVLDDLLPRVVAHEALAMLARLAARTPFQPQRDRSARLDVLGLLEAEGGRWDGVWVMGLTDQVLPAVPSPNPLIPTPALARAGAPRSTPARELQWAQRLYAEILCLAPSLVFSWSVREGESENRPSPLLASLGPAALASEQTSGMSPDGSPVVSSVVSSETSSEALSELARQTWRDEAQIPLQPNELITGGVDVLERQAMNPQWAFFRYRLRTRALPAHALAPVMAIPRGLLLHDVARVLWDELGDHATLQKRLPEPGFSKWVKDCVVFHASDHLRHWPVALREMEIERTVAVVLAWFEFELGREPFRVLEKETSHQLVIGSLSLNVKLDRLDELADGRLFLIDYKTGRHVPKPAKQWSGPQLRDIQLLAYAKVLQDGSRLPSAMGWYRLHSSGIELQGVADESLGLAQVQVLSDASWGQSDWLEQVTHWSDALQALGHSFSQGQTLNQFWRREDTLYCDLGALLRLHQESDDD